MNDEKSKFEASYKIATPLLSMLLVSSIAFAGAVIFYFYKLSQTSQWALSTSAQVRADVAAWETGLMLGGLFVAIVFIAGMASKKTCEGKKKDYMEALKKKITHAKEMGESSEEVELESELRRIEALKIGAKW